MAKSTGLGMTISIDDSGGTARDISNDINSIDIATPRGVQDVTGVDKSANERLLVLADANGNVNGIWNPAANPSSHGVFSTVPSSSAQRTFSWGLGGKTLAMEFIFSDYQLRRPNNGELTFSAPGALANGAVPTWA